MKPQILVVDDEADNIDALERLFRKKYEVFKAQSGPEGLKILKKHPDIALIISDQRMPEMLGTEFLSESIQTHPESMRILLTGYTDIDSVIDAINSGQIYRYVTKPWDPVDFANAADKAIERFELGAELKKKNKQLASALEELKTLDQAKTQFMMLVNHELKTPLTSIISYSDLLKESSLSDDDSKFVGRISEGAQRLKTLVDESMLLLEAETGLLKVKKTSQDPSSLLNDDLLGLKPTADKNNQTVSCQLDSAKVSFDKDIIIKVLNNLVQNAIVHGDKDSEIKVLGKSLKDEESQVNYSFAVENSGKSLSKKQIQKITQPFELNEEAIHHSTGLGLGLSLAQALLKTHGSQLEITSAKGLVRVEFQI